MSENNKSTTQNADVAFQLRAIGQQLELLSRTYKDLKDEVNSIKQQNSGADRRGNTVRMAVRNVRSDFEKFIDENADASEEDYDFTNKPMILLVYKEAYFNINDLDHIVPSVAISLLQEFDDVFPNDTPSGLPPLRGIKHQIDFVPGASIPNWRYRSNPEETRELQRQVDELMEKGYIRESMSPCAVPCYLCLRKMEHGGCVLIAEPLTT
jgi:hypothetical protein